MLYNLFSYKLVVNAALGNNCGFAVQTLTSD